MITLSLDEYGDFENVKKDTKDAVFIGGVLFDDFENPDEIKAERERIQAYYEMAAELASKESGLKIRFPFNLHTSTQNNGVGVGPYKKVVSETLGEFLTKGTFYGEKLVKKTKTGLKELYERTGKYYLYVMVKSDEGKKEWLRASVSSLVKDDVGSNLYFHMASEVLLRTIFQNFNIAPKSNFNLIIATRSSATMLNSDPLTVSYKKLGYEPIEFEEKKVKIEENVDLDDSLKKLIKSGLYQKNKITVTLPDGKKAPGIRFQLTNKDIYRTVITEHLTENNYLDMHLSELNVKSISYYGPNNNEFLYLADSFCSILSFQLNENGRNDAYSWMNEMLVRSELLLPEDRVVVFAYDSIDVDYSNAIKAYLQGDYYKTLEIMYDAIQKKGPFADYYKKHWFALLREKMIKEANKQSFIIAVNTFYNSQLSNTYFQGKGIFIRDTLEEMIPGILPGFKTPESQTIFFKFYETSVIAYNHLGESDKAEEYYNKAIKYAERVPAEECIRLRNTLAVAYSDDLRWNDALELVKENVVFTEITTDLKKEIFKSDSRGINTTLGKSLSQLGQVYSYIDTDLAEEAFEKALNCFEKDSADYYITDSYYLHLLILKNDRDKYEKELQYYLGGNDNPKDQLNFILKQINEGDSLVNPKFALFIYLKGLCKFDISNISDGLWKKLLKFTYLKDKNSKYLFIGHPYELSLKYLFFIAKEKNDIETMESIKNILEIGNDNNGKLIESIRLMSLIEMAEKCGDAENRNVLIYKLAEKLNKEFVIFKNLDINADAGCLYNTIRKYFTYMYD